MQGKGGQDLVGRDRPLAAVASLVDRVLAGERACALVAGEAGIGKTALLRAAAAHGAAGGARIAWGTCLDVDGAPGFWPWAQAIEQLLAAVPAARDVLGEGAERMATIVPLPGAAEGVSRPGANGASERDRLLAMDATRRLVETIGAERPLVIVLDDLQWADASSLALLDLVTRSPTEVGLGIIGAYRDDEVPGSTRQRLSSLASQVDHLHLEGLDIEAVRMLVEHTTGASATREEAAAMHRLTGGHPFFVRELALLGTLADHDARSLPVAVRDAIERRLARLPHAILVVLEAAAVCGVTVLPDVVAAATGASLAEVEVAIEFGLEGGVLTRSPDGIRIAHDLLRETLHRRVEAGRRAELHLAIGCALEDRVRRSERVAPADLARHFRAAISLDGPDRARRWALAASMADRSALAFAEAAGHLRRFRGALADAAMEIDDEAIVEVLLAEADALARAGESVDARGLLRHADDLAIRAGNPRLAAQGALATAHLGSRFATRRDDIVRQLDRAREAVAGTDDTLEARLTATLARELQHSVADDRPRAAALSELALELGRRAGEPSTLLDCLLARHDVLWHPGHAEPRAAIAREIVDVSIAARDDDRQAEGLLLLANALLEQGSPAFQGPLESCLAILDRLGQPRHRYLALTRRACLALLRGRLSDAAELIDDARRLGDRILEPDAGNVYMSQRLELVRARNDPEELTAFASDAIGHWTGAPIHAHAVAAGFLARAGDLHGAEAHVAAVVDLGTWRADRSYLWSVFVRELAVAAVALGDESLCRELLEDLRPLAGTCGVNGAVVAFAGSHAQPAALVSSVVEGREAAELLAEEATSMHRRLGATGWEVPPGMQRPPAAAEAPRVSAAMRREGSMWHLTFGGRTATLAHAKGLADIARLLAALGAEIHALDLVDASLRDGGGGEVADRRALAAYRERVTDLDTEIDDAERDNDHGRVSRLVLERQALLDELGRVTGSRGQPRQFANHPAERARKAVTARIRDAIRKVEAVLPELAAHLQRTIVTGTYCRYRPDGVAWHVDDAERD